MIPKRAASPAAAVAFALLLAAAGAAPVASAFERHDGTGNVAGLVESVPGRELPPVPSGVPGLPPSPTPLPGGGCGSACTFVPALVDGVNGASAAASEAAAAADAAREDAVDKAEDGAEIAIDLVSDRGPSTIEPAKHLIQNAGNRLGDATGGATNDAFRALDVLLP